MKKFFYVAALCAIVGTSCSSSGDLAKGRSSRDEYTLVKTERTGKTLTPYSEPMMADLDVNLEQKVTGTFKATNKEITLMSLETMKNNAVYNALNSGEVKYDVLVYPQYEIVKTDNVSKKDYTEEHDIVLTVKVSGYPAVYKNYRVIPKAESIDLYKLDPNSPYVIEKKTSSGRTVDYEVINESDFVDYELITTNPESPNVMMKTTTKKGKK